MFKFEINRGTKMWTPDNRRQQTTTPNKMFGIAKVARVLGAHVVFAKKFRTGKDIEKSRLFFEFLHP